MNILIFIIIALVLAIIMAQRDRAPHYFDYFEVMKIDVDLAPQNPANSDYRKLSQSVESVNSINSPLQT